MATEEARYWVYSHDEVGEIIDSIGFFDTLSEALAGLLEELTRLVEQGLSAVTVRIVDQSEQVGGSTIWMAGPKDRYAD